MVASPPSPFIHDEAHQHTGAELGLVDQNIKRVLAGRAGLGVAIAEVATSFTAASAVP
jgi:hypothetical protein